MLSSKNRVFYPYFSIETCSMRKRLLGIIRGLDLLSFSLKNISISLKLFSGHFMDNPSLRLPEVLCAIHGTLLFAFAKFILMMTMKPQNISMYKAQQQLIHFVFQFCRCFIRKRQTRLGCLVHTVV